MNCCAIKSLGLIVWRLRYTGHMNWIIADLLLFTCSIAVYLAVRKAALSKLPVHFNNLAMFGVPLVVFLVGAVLSGASLVVTPWQLFVLVLIGVILAYLSNVASLKSVELAPNAGYSLVISKSYVVLTTFLAVPLFNAKLTWAAVFAIALIVGFSALIMINPKSAQRAKSGAWLPLAIGAFVGWAFLSLVAKYLFLQGVPPIIFLTYIFAIASACILIEMLTRRVDFTVIKRKLLPFLLIGVTAAGFNFFNFYTISIAPNIGYVNATNAASIGVVTVLSIFLFKDEFSIRKLVGVAGVIGGLFLLFLG
jgi:drug/metabolite transporter (DMT)-like permease